VQALIAPFEMAAKACGPAKFDGAHNSPLCRGQGSTMLFPIGFAVTTQHISHFQLGAIHEPATQKYWGAAGFGSVGTGCGSRSSGLTVEQTLLVAMRKYRAVVAKLRWPSRSWMVRTSVPYSSKCTAKA